MTKPIKRRKLELGVGIASLLIGLFFLTLTFISTFTVLRIFIAAFFFFLGTIDLFFSRLFGNR